MLMFWQTVKFNFGIGLERSEWSKMTSERYLYDPVWLGSISELWRSAMGSARRGATRERLNHTSYCPSLFRVLAAYEEDYVPLGGIDIVVLKEEDLVDTIFLEGTELDKQSNSSSQGLFNDQILLASDLESVSTCAYFDRQT
jgi:hypothetical protein